MPETKSQNFARIEELKGFEIVEGEPDVRGWEVISRDGRRIGVVEDLLVETEDRTIRYLEVWLDHLPEGSPGVPEMPAPEIPARRIGESLVRDSLLDIENRMTAGQPRHKDGSRTLIPIERARPEIGKRQIHLQ